MCIILGLIKKECSKKYNVMKTFGEYFFVCRKCVILYLFLLFSSVLSAQVVSVKTNAAYWGVLTPNVALELPVGQKFTTDWHFLLNPWTFSDNKKMKIMAVQPELRYLVLRAFQRTFSRGSSGGRYIQYRQCGCRFQAFRHRLRLVEGLPL